MKLRFPVAALFAGVLVLFLALSIGRKSNNGGGKAQPPSTTVGTRIPSEKSSAATPDTPGSSRMIVDAVDDKAPQDGTGEAFPESRSIAAALLKGTVAAKAKATLTIGDRIVSLEPNQIGAFPQQLVQTGQKITVQMVYPEGSPGDLVVAAVLDGGHFDNRQRVLPLRLDESRRVTFNYALSEEEGIFRVTVRRKGDVKTVQLWAGPELVGGL